MAHRGERGFTLLETLAALSIFAFAMISLYGAYTAGLQAAHKSDEHAEAQLLAQSLLARVSMLPRGALRTETGNWHSFNWRVTVNPAAPHLSGDVASAGLQLYHIAVDVRWSQNREIHLETLELRRRTL